MKKLRTIVSIILTLVLFSSMTFGVLAESSTGTVDSSAGEVDVTITVEKDGANSTTTVETENGGLHKALTPDSAPEVKFHLGEEKPVAVYAYCNLHGLWMTEV